ncbi:hypothetical protein RFI_35748, partial [Reticulomyxa filosa]
SVVFKKRNYNAMFKENTMKNGNKCVLSPVKTLSHTELMKVLSKQLKVRFNELYNEMAVKQALITKAKIYAIQMEHFIIVTNQPTKYIFNCTLIQLNESNSISFINLTFPNLFKVLKRLIMNGSNFILIFICFIVK